MLSGNIGHAEQFSATNKSKGRSLTSLLRKVSVFNSKSKIHSNSNEIDYQWSMHWLLQAVKILEKNKISQLLESTLRSQPLESTAANCYYFFVKYFIHFFHKLCSHGENLKKY